MKKSLFVILLILTAFTAFASVGFVLNVKPYFTFDNSPAGIAEDRSWLYWNNGSALVKQGEEYVYNGEWNGSGLVNANWWETKQDYFNRAFSKPGFLDIGFVVDTDKVGMVFLLDIRQDTFQHFKDDGKILTNIPFVGAMIDLNFPRVGYVDFTSSDESFYASVGRRQIKWGPSTYDMAISDSQPYLDNFYLSYETPVGVGTWNFKYDFTGIAYKLFMNYSHNVEGGQKSTFAHRFAFGNDSVRIAVAELNNVYGKEPSLLDFTPFGIWHDNYQDDYSNVMLNLAVEGVVGPVRLYGTFTMDDFDLPHELGSDGWSGKPQAMGFTAGVEVHILDGEPVKSSRFEYNEYALKDDTFRKIGLNIGYEFYYCSTFMYNRDKNAGKYTVPFQFISLTGAGYCFDDNAFYLGFKYGPDTMVNRLFVEYESNPLSAFASAELIMRGSYTIDSEYGNKDYYNDNGLSKMKLNDPVVTVLKLEAGASYNVQKGLKASVSLGFTRDITHGTSAFAATIGASVAVMDVDWNSLF